MKLTKFHVLTLFPEMILQGMSLSIIGRAVENGILSLDAVDIRAYTLDKHGKVDDYPYGGGAGMLMQAQPVYDAHRAVTEGRAVRTVYVTPQGRPFTQRMAKELAQEEELVFLCGHYEGIDQRVLDRIVTDEVSIGDYVLTGGELPAMVMIDAIARLIPGVLGNDSSSEEESFYNDLLEYPQYSRPRVWQGESVPEVLLSGDHRKISAWRLEQSKQRTAGRRPDLYERYEEKQRIIKGLSREKRSHIHMMESLARGRGEIVHADGGDILIYDEGCGLCMVECTGREGCESVADRIPGEAKAVLTSLDSLKDAFVQRQYQAYEYVQMLYTPRETLPVKYKEIRPLTAGEYESAVEFFEELHRETGRCRESGRADVQGIREGNLYGAFSDGSLVGCIAVQKDGSLSLPAIKAESGQEILQSLLAYAVNSILERGWTPYMHVPVEETSVEGFLEGLGFYKAKKTLWRLEKILANEI